MKKYIVEAPIMLHAGILEITIQQAESRKHLLVNLGDGKYEIKSSVQFKSGEEIGYNGDVGKNAPLKLVGIDNLAEVKIFRMKGKKK